MIVLRQQSSQPGFGAIFEMPSRPLRNYHFIYWSSLTTVWFALDFPVPMNIRVGSLRGTNANVAII
jgi:hypothetical protein